jgi:hypothetical protein
VGGCAKSVGGVLENLYRLPTDGSANLAGWVFGHGGLGWVDCAQMGPQTQPAEFSGRGVP